MLVIHANQKQEEVFNKLIQEIDAQVVWNGRFVIMGDRLILEGFVRSLFFHFDIQKTEVQFIDQPTDEEEELEISEHPELEDLITMAVYAFGKWGAIKGVQAEQDISQLNQLFAEILGAYDLEIAFSEDKIEFYRLGMCITYEDVVETVLKFDGVKVVGQRLKLPVISGQDKAEKESGSQKTPAAAGRSSGGADADEVEKRIEKYHARISVLDRLSQLQRKALERDIRNDHLLSEAQKEELYFPIHDFERQKKMYAAQAVLGGASAGGRDPKAAAAQLEKYYARIGVIHRMSDLQKKTLERDIRNDQLLNEKEKERLQELVRAYEEQKNMETARASSAMETKASSDQAQASKSQPVPVTVRDPKAVAVQIEKYHARIGVLDRLSSLQKKALVRDIRSDSLLSESEKETLLFPIQDFEYQKKMQEIDKELSDKSNKTYAHIQTMIKRAEQDELFEKTKQAVLERLYELHTQLGMQEVKMIMENAPQHVERDEFKQLMEQLAPYEDIDLGEYALRLKEMRETLEIKEISNLLMQSPKKDRRDYMELLRSIEEHDFAEENAAPYIERIMEWVSELDEAALKKMAANAGSMDYDTAASAYIAISRGSFLPKLKAGALSAVSKRLDEISLSDCRLLVRALEKVMSGAVKENPRHHFYPAEKILAKTAKPEDVRLIENAAAAYAEKRGRFEYPLLMVDTSKECSGRDGMLLTPQHLFYSTRMNGYQISIQSVKSIYVSQGLLKNKALIAEEANGVRHKLPYAVDAEEMKVWAKVLDKFVKYLQGRPGFHKLSSESLEDAGAVSCRRCGCVYHDSPVCPECGYKKNI